MHASSVTTTIIKTRTDVTVLPKTEKDTSKTKGRKYTILSEENLQKIEARRQELVQLIAALPPAPKKLQERLNAWEEWGRLSKTKYKHQILELEQKIASLETNIENIEYWQGWSEAAYQTKLEELEKAYEATNSRLAEQREQNNTLQGRVKELSLKLDESKRQAKCLQSDLKKAKEASSDLSTRLTAQLEQNNTLQGRVNELYLKVNDTKRQANDLQGDMELYRDRRDRLREHLKQEEANYQLEKAKWSDYKNQLLKEIDQQKLLQAESAARIALLESAATAKEVQVGSLSKELEESRTERDKFKRSHAELSTRIETQDGEIQALKANIASLTKTNEDLQANVDAAKRAKTEKQDAEIQALKAKIADLQKVLKDEREVKDSATKRIRELLKENSELHVQNDELHKENEKLQKSAESKGAGNVTKKRKGK